jgi:alpha-ketoglutarate-dependent taurine dioxygenase
MKSHVVVRGLPTDGNEGAAIPVALSLSKDFKSYDGRRILRVFRMSPWRKGLSHNIKAGDFHTDFSTASFPPAITVIHCLEADPGGSGYGENRVALFSNLHEELERRGEVDALRFLLESDVPVMNEFNSCIWQGRLVRDGNIRYHPETILAAFRTQGLDVAPLEKIFRAIYDAAFCVSRPISLSSGDVLLVSNLRALHYRGECTVKFVQYPSIFEARRIVVFHLNDEGQLVEDT